MICANDHKVETIFMLKARLETTICLMETMFGDPWLCGAKYFFGKEKVKHT